MTRVHDRAQMTGPMTAPHMTAPHMTIPMTAPHMTMVSGTAPPAGARPLRRWLFAAAAALLVHAGLVGWMLWRPRIAAEGAPPEAIMIELEAVAAAPPSETQVEAPPGPLMTEAEPDAAQEPDQTIIPDLPQAPKPEAVLVSKPKENPVKKPKKLPVKHEVTPTRDKPAPRTTAPAHAAASSRAAAGRPGSAGSSMSASTWISQVHARIQAHHAYPPGAQGQKGTAKVAFSIDRGGHITSVSLAASSGSGALDQAALATVRRSSPLPPPPPGIGGSMSIPVAFH